MKILKFSNFVKESVNTHNYYKNIDNMEDGEPIDYYNVPFSLGENGVCITGYNKNTPEDKYVLCLTNYYIYDYVTDDMIANELKNDLSNVDVSRDWTNYNDGYEHSGTDKNKHAKRIAKLVQELKQNKPLKPVSMYFDERSYIHDIYNYIEDGNHRIRALQYLKYSGYPAYIHGGHSEFLIKYIRDNEGKKI